MNSLPTLASFEFYAPTKIIAGRDALASLASELLERKLSRPLLLSDPGLVRVGAVERVAHALAARGIETRTRFTDIPADSSLEAVELARRAFAESGADAIIAIGGGSVLDTAKGLRIALALPEGSDLAAWAGASPVLPVARTPLFAVPTTSGTGSEATLAAVISDPAHHRKLPFSSHALLPDVAVLEPLLTIALPPLLTAATGMDALTHAMEASIGLQKNPVSDAFAASAIRLLRQALPRAIENPADEQTRLDLALGSTLAGIAFSNSMVGVVHALGHAAGALCHLHHGTAMSLFLPVGLRFGLNRRAAAIGELLLPFGGAELYARVPARDRAERLLAELASFRDFLYEKTRLPRTLREAGVAEDKLDAIARAALNDGSIVYCAEEVTLADARRLVQEAF